MTCTDCRFWQPPPPMEPVNEIVAISRGVNRDGACHRFPKAERTQAVHWCGEHEPAPPQPGQAAA